MKRRDAGFRGVSQRECARPYAAYALVAAGVACSATQGGREGGAPEPARAPASPATAAAAPSPASVSTAAVSRAVVELGRVTDRSPGEGGCKSSEDCVVVERYRQEELCPPGLSISRELARREESWRQRGFGYRKRPEVCPEAGLAIQPVCHEEVCAAFRSPATGSATLDERLLGATVPEMDRCYDEELARRPNFTGSALLELVVARTGDVASVTLRGEPPAPELHRCITRIVYRMEFPLPEAARFVTVPLTFARTPSGEPDG